MPFEGKAELLDGLRALERDAAAKRDYATAERVMNARDDLEAQSAALDNATRMVDELSAARRYAEASQAEQGRAQLEAEVEAAMKSIVLEWGRQLSAIHASTSSTVVRSPPQLSQAMTVEPLPAVPVPAVPVPAVPVQPQVVVMGSSLDGDAVRPHRHVITHGAGREPLLASVTVPHQSMAPVLVNGTQAPGGGTWTQEPYVGGVTFFLALFLSPFALCCPCDTRMVYIAPNGQRFPSRGNGLRDAVICIYVTSMVLCVVFIFAFYYTQAPGGSDPGPFPGPTPGPTPGPSPGPMDCDSCIALSSSGWCETDDECWPGSSDGPDNGYCSGSDWKWTSCD